MNIDNSFDHPAPSLIIDHELVFNSEGIFVPAYFESINNTENNTTNDRHFNLSFNPGEDLSIQLL